MKDDEQVRFQDMTKEDIKAVCEWLMGWDQEEILKGAGNSLRVILSNSPLAPMRWVELRPEQLVAVLVLRLNTARAAFFRIRNAFSMRETDAMDWLELAGAAKGAIESVKPRPSGIKP